MFYVRQGPGRRTQGLRARQGRGAHARRAGRPDPRGDVRRRAADRASRSRCWCRYEPEDVATYEEWLCHLRESRVQIRVPQRGDKRALLETVTRNAGEEFTRHRMRRATDHNSRSRALTELQDLLELPEAPLRIECYDMAHLQGTDYVGSMVVMEDGLPAKREYRKFKVHVPGNDDYAAMEEVLTRRLTAYLDERDRPIGERGDKPGPLRLPAAAVARRRRQGPARCRPARRRDARPGRRDPGRRSRQAVRGGLRARAVRPGRDPAGQRGAVHARSASATRPTASPTRSTASAGRSG